MENKESEECMRPDEDNEAYEYIEENTLCFFEFFFVSSGNKHQPSCVDDENNTNNGQESIEKIKNLSDNFDSS